MEYSVLKNKQPKAIKIIENSIKMDRLVQVMLFEGAKGTPKMETALYLASLLLCDEKCACGKCRNCKLIKEGNHPRVYLVDAIDKSIKKEQIEALEHEFSESGLEEGTRVFIINNIEIIYDNNLRGYNVKTFSSERKFMLSGRSISCKKYVHRYAGAD